MVIKNIKVPKIFIYLYQFLAVLSVVVFASFVYNQNNEIKQQSEASLSNSVNLDDAALFSTTEFDENVANVDLYVDKQNGDKPLFTTKEKGAAAVFEFIQKNPTVPEDFSMTDSENVKGVNTQGRRQTILPAHFDKNSQFIRKSSGSAFKVKAKRNVEHFFYSQKIRGLPVFGSVARFDVQNGNQIVGVEGDLLTDQNVSEPVISEGQAKTVAIDHARRSMPKNANADQCLAQPTEKVIVNRALLGLSESDESCESLVVPVCDLNRPAEYNTDVFVCLKTGEVVLENSNIEYALDRRIDNCGGGGCRRARSEGQPAVGDRDVDKSYDVIGQVYNFYSDTFQRDSFDNRGSPLHAQVKYPYPEHNASWSPQERVMRASPGLVSGDVWGHELTHGVTQFTAGLLYTNQSGALNESFSDIFGYANDSEDWSIGEETPIGEVRRMDDPPKGKRGPSPDRLFSSHYYCGTRQLTIVHINSGVLNKAFFLMTDGGSFNGCTIAGIGRDKSLAVAYKALTTYMQPSSNFKDAYEGFLKACGDLYGLESAECQSVQMALQAVEMDQQPANTQAAPFCQKAQPKTAACSGVLPQPTSGVLPTAELSPTTEVPSPSTSPGSSVNKIEFSQECPVTSAADSRQYKSASFVCTDNTTGTAGDGQECKSEDALRSEAEQFCSQNQTPPPTVPPAAENITLTMRLRFQGVLSQPARLTRIPVKVTLAKTDYSYENTKTVDFISDERGVWSGIATFDASPGDGFVVLVKGPMHIQKKIGHTTPTEPQPGTYRSQRASISLTTGENSLDFSGIILLAGDLPDQDGIINSYDISLVRNNIGRVDSSTTRLCDVNFDGICNTQDHSLIIAALGVKVDED